MKNLVLFVLFLPILVGVAKGEGATLAIKLINPSPVQYCTDPIPIAESLTVEGNFAITGMKISFSSGYIEGEDELVYTGSLTQSIPTPGTLVLSGPSSTTIQEYVNAIHSIKYRNKNNHPTLGIRKITISLSDADYLPETGHFYRFVPSLKVTWRDARANAESPGMMYWGLKGYLATITSKIENDFINQKTKGVGWIGASDETVEGEWRWVTGPEGLENGIGRLFWVGKGINRYLPGNGPYLGEYSNWNTNEPNDVGNNEDYAHILFSKSQSSSSLLWNDLPNAGGSNENDTPAGYLIEYGGFKDDPEIHLSATLDLQVTTMSFKNPGIQPAICEGESITLNMEDLAPVKARYTWLPTGSLSDPSIANPVATPKVTTNYVVTGTRGTCPSVTATYEVKVNPKPVSLMLPEYNICKGDLAILDPGAHQIYDWGSAYIDRTKTVNTSGDYFVKITDNNCPATFRTTVTVHEYPTVDQSKLQSLICGEPKSTIVDMISSSGTALTSLQSGDGRAVVSGMNVSVSDFGIYPMVYKTAIYLGCPVTKNFDLAFHKTPSKGLSIKPGECQRYNLDASYNGDADPSIARFTWIFGGDTIANGIGLVKQKIPLGINQSKRDLVLLVEQQGCSNKDIIPEILAIPTLNVSVAKATLCQPESFGFTATNSESGVNARYDWNFGDGNTGTGDKPAHGYANAGKYAVQVTVTTDKKCTNTALIHAMVHVAPVPDVAFSLSPLTCLDPGINTISYAGLVGTANDRYIWDLSNLQNVEILTDPGEKQGPWTFDLKTKPQATIGLKVISEYGCESLPGSVSLKRKPDFSIHSSASEGCISFEPTVTGLISVDDLADKVDFTWDFGDGSTGSGSSVMPIYNDPDKSYNIILSGISLLTQCTNEVTGNGLLKTYPKPKAAFSMDHKVVYNDQPDVKFTDLSTGKPSSWLWDFGDGVTADIQNPVYHFAKMGHQRVLLEATNDKLCTDTVSHDVLVAFDRLFPPNGFSPNAPNGDDRVFLLNSEGIVPEGYHFTVLSRWNDLIFEVKDAITGWDGRMKNGSLAPSGGYVWRLDFTDLLGRRHSQTGTVTLIY